jgi:hypothetical protein
MLRTAQQLRTAQGHRLARRLRSTSRLRPAVAAVASTSAAFMAFAFVAAVLLLVAAGAADAAVWVIPATARTSPSTPPGTSQTISIDAAKNEYEGAQVALSSDGDRAVTFSWSADSDPLIVANTILDQVWYVNITQPTTDLHTRAGLYPDPLLPRSFDSPVATPGMTTSFYLLTHVPPGASGGDYHATLVVQNGAETVQIPFSLHVWDFGWAQLSTRTGFKLNEDALAKSVAGSGLRWTKRKERERLLLNTYVMLQQHGISPLDPIDLPRVSADGTFNAAKYAALLAPYLDAGGLGLTATRIPWIRHWPWEFDVEYDADSPQLMTYLTQLCALYQQHGWQDKAYAYVMDETTLRWEEKTAERYARVLHAASAVSGYRMKFLLTDDPRPRSLGGVKQANRFLFDDVDIWGVRYFYFFGRIPALRKQKAAGQEVWWYTYANARVADIPNFVIEKPNTDQRVWGWLMERWNVDGLMNWALNQWVVAGSPSTYRDPYQDPLSRSTRTRKANGDSSLIYPGYYPGYGLTDPYAAPVSSLRLEALRDGLEDREYLRLAKTLPGGVQVVKDALATITTFPYKVQQKNVFNFPKYTDDPAAFEAARLAVASFIEAYQQ